jgi:hypothetical protein
MFVLQLITLVLGIATIVKANTAQGIAPALLSILALNSLYVVGTRILRSSVSVGFWLSILSTIAILAVMISVRLGALCVTTTRRVLVEDSRSKPKGGSSL